MTGRVDIPWRIIEKNLKELKIKSQDRKTQHFLANLVKNGENGAFLCTVTSIFNSISSKIRLF